MRKLILLFVVFFAPSVCAQPLRFFEFGFRTLPDSMNVIAATTDTTVIAKALSQLALEEAQRNLFINGELQYGTNTNNPIYTWHFVSSAWDLVETSIEVCDGLPSDVENDKDYWIKQVGRFCPWSSFTKKEVTPSEVDGPADPLVAAYPNPTSDAVYFAHAPGITIREITILDELGKMTMYSVPTSNVVNLSSLENGIYYLLAKHTQGNSVFKIAKR